VKAHLTFSQFFLCAQLNFLAKSKQCRPLDSAFVKLADVVAESRSVPVLNFASISPHGRMASNGGLATSRPAKQQTYANAGSTCLFGSLPSPFLVVL